MSTKIFISSVSNRLEETRLQVTSFVKSLGHDPIYFEDVSFAKSSQHMMLNTCLRAVNESQIFVLIIGQEVGTVIQPYNKSVTHLELKKAIASNKTILVFADQYIKNYYFKEFHKVFRELQEIDPHKTNGTLPTVDEVMTKLNGSIDKRVFDILHEAYQVVPWIYAYTNVDDITGVLKSEFSSALSSYTDLKNKKQIHSIEHVISAASRFKQYDDFLEGFYTLIQGVIPISNMEDLLRKIQSSLRGGTIYYDEGAEIKFEFIKVANCDGTSLYKYDGTSNLDLIATSGLARSKRNPIPLSDPDSYVASTFSDAIPHKKAGQRFTSSELFISDERIYLCHVINNHVLTIHFPIEEVFVQDEDIVTKADVLYEGLLSLMANNDIMKIVQYCLD